MQKMHNPKYYSTLTKSIFFCKNFTILTSTREIKIAIEKLINQNNTQALKYTLSRYVIESTVTTIQTRIPIIVAQPQHSNLSAFG